MVCPQCSYANPETSIQCEKCSTPFPLSDQTLATGVKGWSVPSGDVVISQAVLAQLSPGTVLAARYEIIRLLGQGGMGAVYQARDHELDRQVALKVIRADMVANPEILNRFKQELILARQITHKNVIRIFDLGQADGIKFITMEYIEGEDLQSILRRKKKLEAAEGANIIAQVSRALEAAHAEGVIHRDLKPQNIRLDKSGRAYVMDFGIARSSMASGMTQTGALIGTPDYMSPEQAKGLPLDARSDLFTVGIIFYEILSGRTPFESDTTMGRLWKRTSEPARPLGELDQTIPQALCDIVRKCLEIDPQKRFASATELLQQIELWQGPSAGTRVIIQQQAGLPAYAKWVGAGLAVALLAVGFFLRSTVGMRTAAPHAPVSVLIADFTNDTADSIFDGTLEPMLGVALEGASFISLYNRGQARKVAVQLQPGATTLDEKLARLIATREGINTVIGGSIVRQGDSYRVVVRAVDGVTGKVIATDSDKVQKKDVLVAMGKLAAGIREALGDKTPESVQLASAETYTTRSLDAAHEYALAQVAQFSGKYSEAIEHSLRALQLDPELGRAYVVLAVVYNNMKQPQNAEKYFNLALSKIDHMSEREKYRTRSAYYLVARKPEKAVEESQQLVKKFPADNTGLANLALAYFYRRDMASALEEGRRAVQIYPKNTIQQNNVGLYAMYAGNFDAAIQEQLHVREMNPSLVLGYVGTALPQLALGHPNEATTTYHELEKLGADGVSAAAAGLADIALYQGSNADAIKILNTAASRDLANKDPDGAATKLAYLAQAQLLDGNPAEAARTATRALSMSQQSSIQFWAARAYIGANLDAKAQSIAREMGSGLEADPQAYSKLIEGEIQLKHGKVQTALKLFLESRKLADTWMGRFDAGRAYVDAGAFAEAESELEACIRRRGEATALFLDESPTYHLFPAVYYYLGRAQEGLRSPAAAESYKSFLSLKERANRDPLVADARQRLSKQ